LVEKFEKIKVRAITIAVGIPIVLFIIHQGGILFNLTVVLLAIIGTLELWHIIKTNYQPSLILGFVASLFFLLKSTIQESFFIAESLLFTFIILAIFMEHFLLKRKNLIVNISTTLFIAIYIGHFLSFLIKIRGLEDGSMLLIFALFTTWMSDTAAYIVGVYFGNRHIFPTISPNKTLEGSIGGILGGAICGIAFYFILPINPIVLFALGLLAAICGQTGDLFESTIKRNFNVKDSGKLLPGHGGILDCMDSILFSGPIIYFCFLYLIK
jgi:phosphatidate cytidylyltransferase